MTGQSDINTSMEYFVKKDSVVRQIWGKGDIILIIFAGAAAEFALNKSVDWLYFTGRLPADPLGRLFSTVSYARQIVFSEKAAAEHAIDNLSKVHAEVEAKRGFNIPDQAYRDVLFMLIDYSMRSFEVLERQLTRAEMEEVFEVFYSLGKRMGVKGLPENLQEWERMRKDHLECNLKHSSYTDDLFHQYRNHLGVIRYQLLLEVQSLVVPQRVRGILGLRNISLLNPLIRFYKLSRSLKIDWLLKSLIMPNKYKNEIKELDVPHIPDCKEGRENRIKI